MKQTDRRKDEKGIEAFSLPPLMRKQISALIDSGYYTSRSDVIKDAVRNLLETKKGYAFSAAMHLYRNKMISVEEAALMCGKDEKDIIRAAKNKK